MPVLNSNNRLTYILGGRKAFLTVSKIAEDAKTVTLELRIEEDASLISS